VTSRRDFLKTAALGAMTTSVPGLGAERLARSAPSGIVFDAMGEIRTIYTMELIDQILASGTNAIGVTVTDPKVVGDEGFHALLRDLAAYDAWFAAHASHFIRARTVADIDRARRERKLAVFTMIQDSSPVEKSFDRLDVLHALGLRSVQLTYNTRNFVGDGCFESTDAGLSAFGVEFVARMNAKRMLVDLSHAGMRTMSAAIAASALPVIVSHTCCRALYAHRRNTTDENLRALASRGGVVGICQIRTFMTEAKKDNLDVYFDHIDHAVKVAGIEHVAIGSDRDHRVIPDSEEEIRILLREEGAQFKPDDWPLYLEKLNGPRRMDVVRDGLARRGYTQDQADHILGANLYRLYRDSVG
jgi:membrane dipeptidase